MITRAVLRYIRISPRKFRLVIPLVKGKSAEEAVAILESVKKKGARYASDVIKSAIANVKKRQGVDVSALYISKLIASPGPMLKRYRAASMGRASSILKRTSHITVELDQVNLSVEEKAKKASAGHSKEEKAAKAKHKGSAHMQKPADKLPKKPDAKSSKEQ